MVMNANNHIEDICRKVPFFTPLYNARVRHYVIREHIINVYNQFERYFSNNFDESKKDWFRLFLLLHDIGKSVAFKKGNRENQIMDTIILIEQYKTELDLSGEKVGLYNALLKAGNLGKYMESKISLDDAYNTIMEQSNIVKLPPKQFLYLSSVYYQCDVASYTRDAGGIPFLEHLFEYQNGEKVYCDDTHLLKLSEVYAKKYSILSNKIHEYIQNHNNGEESTEVSGASQLKIIGKIDLSKFEKPKKEIRKDKENIYIIDTNVFIDCPDIITKIDKQYQIVLSAKVIDELDYLKISLTEDKKRNVQKALKLINEGLDKRNVKMNIADITLLPDDLNKKSPDNLILSVALKHLAENPILLTSDNGLQAKAKGFGVTTITLREFLKQTKY